MKEYVKTIWNEIREGKNIDVYLTMLVCGMLLVFDIFGVTSGSLISEGILATLLLIALSTLNSRHANSNIEKALKDISISKNFTTALSFFREWNENHFKERLIAAREISFLTIANYQLISQHSVEIKDFLQRGGKLRCIYIKPNDL